VTHYASSQFWASYDRLPPSIQRLADANYELLVANARHPSLHFKKIGRYWSVRVGLHFRALAVEDGSDIVWFWVGPHDVYDKLLSGA